MPLDTSTGRFETDIDILDNVQPAKSGIGVVDIAAAEEEPRPDKAVFDQCLATYIGVIALDEIVVFVLPGVGDVDSIGSRRVVGEHEIDFAHVVALVRSITRRVDHRIGPYVQRQVHRLGVVGGIGRIGDELLVEGIETVAPQDVGDALPLLVEHVPVEVVALLQERMVREPPLDQPRQSIVGNVIIDIGYIVRRIGRHAIDHIHALAPRSGIGLDPGRHIALVEHRLLHLQARVLHQHRVVDDGRGSGISHPAVEPLGRVVAREVVEPQRETKQAEHPVVGLLSQIRLQIRGFHLLRIGLYLHMVEQIAAVGDMTGRTARHQHPTGDGYSTGCYETSHSQGSPNYMDFIPISLS